MAVYTDISGVEFAEFLQHYSVGEFRSAQGIAEGVENTNYILLTTKDTFIATLFEKQIRYEDLEFFMCVLQHMAKHQIPCPSPVADKTGKVIQQLKGKHASLVSFLEGSWPRRITPNHCRELGAMLAKMHLAAEDSKLQRDNTMGVPHFAELYSKVEKRIEELGQGLGVEISERLAFIKKHWPKDLPKGIVHADLFPDNVFFQNDKLTGVIDFYFACNDFYAYDLAICLNAWCFEDRAEFNITKAKQLLDGYEKNRPLSAAEKDAFPLLAQAAAMRFFLSRAIAYLHQVEGALVRVKDPKEYLTKLRFHQSVKHIKEYVL